MNVRGKIGTLVALAALAAPACATAPPVRAPLPPEVLAPCESYLGQRLTPDFAGHYVTLDAAASHREPGRPDCESCLDFVRRPYYLVVYRFAIPDRPWVRGTFEFVVDERGAFVPERPPTGVPDCAREPVECTFPIDEERAVAAARAAGLPAGPGEWRARFDWAGGKWNTFAWSVRATRVRSDHGAAGREALVDANTGEVLETVEWEETS
jgi:hypothetical protein